MGAACLPVGRDAEILKGIKKSQAENYPA